MKGRLLGILLLMTIITSCSKDYCEPTQYYGVYNGSYEGDFCSATFRIPLVLSEPIVLDSEIDIYFEDKLIYSLLFSGERKSDCIFQFEDKNSLKILGSGTLKGNNLTLNYQDNSGATLCVFNGVKE